MATQAQIVFTDHDGNTLDLLTKNAAIQYVFPLTIERKNGLVGVTVDPIRQYRIVTCTAKLTAAQADSLDTQLMDSTKVYDGTDPKIVLYLSGTLTKTIYVAVTSVIIEASPDGQWYGRFTFTERSS